MAGRPESSSEESFGRRSIASPAASRSFYRELEGAIIIVGGGELGEVLYDDTLERLEKLIAELAECGGLATSCTREAEISELR